MSLLGAKKARYMFLSVTGPAASAIILLIDTKKKLIFLGGEALDNHVRRMQEHPKDYKGAYIEQNQQINFMQLLIKQFDLANGKKKPDISFHAGGGT